MHTLLLRFFMFRAPKAIFNILPPSISEDAKRIYCRHMCMSSVAIPLAYPRILTYHGCGSTLVIVLYSLCFRLSVVVLMLPRVSRACPLPLDGIQLRFLILSSLYPHIFRVLPSCACSSIALWISDNMTIFLRLSMLMCRGPCVLLDILHYCHNAPGMDVN